MAHAQDIDLQDLQRRVEKFSAGHSISPISEVVTNHVPVLERGAATVPQQGANSPYVSRVTLTEPQGFVTVSPGSSVNSLSPPVSPYSIGPPPPSYEQHMSQRQAGFPPSNVPSHNVPSLEQNLLPPHAGSIELPSHPTEGVVTVTANRMYGRPLPQLPINSSEFTDISAPPSTGGGNRRSFYMDSDITNPPLSPISETSSGVCNNLSGVNTRSVSAAVSDESVAGDSGVFEAAMKK